MGHTQKCKNIYVVGKKLYQHKDPEVTSSGQTRWSSRLTTLRQSGRRLVSRRMSRVQIGVESSSTEIDDNAESANPACILPSRSTTMQSLRTRPVSFFPTTKKNPTRGFPHHQRYQHAGGRVFVNWAKSLCVRQKVCGGCLRTTTFKGVANALDARGPQTLLKVRHVPDDHAIISHSGAVQLPGISRRSQ